MCREEELTKDLAQETFLKIYVGLRKFRGECSEKTWCLKVARNVFLTYARKKQPDLLEENILEEIEAPLENLPEEKIIRDEEKKLVQKVLLMLSEMDRSLLLWKDYEGLSCKEIGQMLDLTEGNVKVRLHRIRQKYKILYLKELKRMEGM